MLLYNSLIELDAASFHLCEFYTVAMYNPNIMGPHSVRKVKYRAHSKECGHTITTLLKEMKVFHAESKSGSDIFRTESVSSSTRHSGSRIIGWKVCVGLSDLLLFSNSLSGFGNASSIRLVQSNVHFYLYSACAGLVWPRVEMIPLNE